MKSFNTKLAWLPIHDTIRTRNLSLFHEICNGNGPKIIFPHYVNFGKTSHGHYNTRTSRKNDPITSKCKQSSDPRNAVNEHFNINYIYCMDNQVYIIVKYSTSTVNSYSSVGYLF